MIYQLHHGDCIKVMRGMPDNSVDSIVTDPPYELGFMGKSWDASGIAYNVDMWREALRVLKPGGHLLAFSGSRTYHRMTCAIEDAGFEIRDQIMWVYGSGFPKSLDVSKAIDKVRDDRDYILRVTSAMADAAERAGVSRADVDAAMGTSDMGGWWLSRLRHRCQCPKWEQWLQLKPLLQIGDELDGEVWRLNGRKGTPGEAWGEREVVGQETKARSTSGASALPTVGGETVYKTWNVTAPSTDAARQWEGWGTALKPAHEPICVARKPPVGTVAANVLEFGTGALNIDASRIEGRERTDYGLANATRSAGNTYGTPTESADFDSEKGRWPANFIHAGLVESWSRYFYCAKASKSDRGAGNVHPTVKPTDLMAYLCRLVTPPGGLVLDPFMGSGSTGKAAAREGFRFVGIDMTAEYVEIARARIEHSLFGDLL